MSGVERSGAKRAYTLREPGGAVSKKLKFSGAWAERSVEGHERERSGRSEAKSDGKTKGWSDEQGLLRTCSAPLTCSESKHATRSGYGDQTVASDHFRS